MFTGIIRPTASIAAARGEAYFPNLPVGTYPLAASIQGFKPTEEQADIKCASMQVGG